MEKQLGEIITDLDLDKICVPHEGFAKTEEELDNMWKKIKRCSVAECLEGAIEYNNKCIYAEKLKVKYYIEKLRESLKTINELEIDNEETQNCMGFPFF